MENIPIYERFKKGLSRRYRKYFEKQAVRELKKNSEFWKTISDYIGKTGSTGCSYADYLVLYNYIRTKKPKEVLECGTGTSTIVMAYGMLENERESGTQGRITSVEESEEWRDIAYTLLPDNLKKYVEILFSQKVEDCHALFRGVRYEHIPDRQYEFVFIDGPSTSAPSDKMKTFDFDFIRVVEKSNMPVSAIIDCRPSTSWALSHIFGKNKFYFDYKRNLGFLDSCSKDDLKTRQEILSNDFYKGIKGFF